VYEIRTRALQTAQEYSAAWEKRRVFRIHEVRGGKLMARIKRGVVTMIEVKQ
jgi:hypothetical protein